MPIIDTRTATTTSGLLCIDYCLDAGNEQDYAFMIDPYYAVPTSYELYEGFDNNGWAIGSHGGEIGEKPWNGY